MVSHVNTLTFSGVDITDVNIQCHLAPGMPAFNIVGLPDKTIAESKERVRAALTSIGIALPPKRITINLAPADLLKEGSHFDLAIACCLLVALGLMPEDEIQNYLILGELSLDGTILPVAGILPAAIGANARRKGIICPGSNGKEAAWSANQNIIASTHLINLINHFKGTQLIAQPELEIIDEESDHPDMQDVKGQDIAKRVIEITASGGHNLLMNGPPGVGKTLLARCLAGILPKMSAQEMLECSMVTSIAGLLVNGKLQRSRPFRAPHHSCSMAAMVGGGFGKRIMPGEISLAHNGVLFLDELPEFPRVVLDSLRQPLETGSVLIARANSHVTFPSKFQLVAAMNPCRCGYLTDPMKSCGKAPNCATDYQNKISGPLLDRIDLHIEVDSLTREDFASAKQGESSDVIAARIEKVRQTQLERYEGYNIRTNAELEGKLLLEVATPTNEALAFLNQAADKMGFSMRSYNRVLRVARTIADMEEAKLIDKHHIAESLSYRPAIIKKTLVNH